MKVVIISLFTWISWRITEGATMSTHLRLEPPGSSHSFFTGDSFFITCLAREESSATRLTWQAPTGKDITNSHGRIHVEPSPDNPLGLQLVMEDTRFKDRGSYTCSAIVERTEVRTRFSLLVHQSIEFLGTPLVQHGIEGNDLLVECKVRSDPPALLSWYFNGTLVSGDGRYNTTEDGLYIRRLQRSDAGTYTCTAFVVTPHSSQMKNIHIRLDVHYRPVWRTPSRDVAYGLIGGTAHLVCEAHAKPPPTFEWFRGPALLENSRNYRITNHKWKSILQVKIIGSSAFGNYRCVASNPLGEARKTIALFEGVYPGRPSLVAYSNQPGTILVQFKPSVLDTLPVLGYKLQCRLLSDTWSNVKEHHVYGKHEVLLQDLSFESVYVLRVRARNDIGYGNYSEEVAQTTKGIIAETVMGSPAVSSPPNCAKYHILSTHHYYIIIMTISLRYFLRTSTSLQISS